MTVSAPRFLRSPGGWPGCAVDLWFGQLSTAPGDAELLNVQERARAARFLRPEDRDAYVARHARLRRVLAEYTGGDPSGVAVEQAPGGKPRLAGATGGGLAFNMSSSGDLLVIAVAPGGDIGIDVEAEASAPAVSMSLLGELAPIEREHVLQQRNTEEVRSAYLRCWTAREAVVKATGHGLRTPLDSFEVDPESGRVVDYCQRPGMPTTVHWHRPAPGYIGALAWVRDH